MDSALSKIDKFLDRIINRDWNPMHYLNVLWWRIIHICRWIPILWRDADYDYSYLLIIMRFKIRLMRERMESCQIITDWKKISEQMKVAEDALSRIIANDYVKEEWERYERECPRVPMSQWEKTKDGHLIMPSLSGKASNYLKKIHNKEEKLILADLTELGRIFVEEIRGWWD